MRKKNVYAIAFILAFPFVTINAQVGGIVYEPYNPNKTVQQPSIYSVTAFMVNYGKVQRMQLRVAVNGDSYNNLNMKVVAYFNQSSYMGYWQKLGMPINVSKCFPSISGNDLESQFMYKAFIGTDWVYFNL